MPDRIFGLPMWAAIATVGAAGVVGYLIFFRNQGSSGGGTTGYSAQGLAVMQNPDESATMSAQNQLLSQLALNQETGFQSLTDQLGQVGSSVDTGFSSVGTSLNSLSGQVGTLQSTQTAGLTGLSNQIAGVSTQQGQLSASQQAYYSGLLANLTNYYNALSGQLSGVGSQVAGVGGQVSGVSGQVAGVSGQVNTVGNQISDTWGAFQSITRGIHDLENRLGLPPT